MSLCAVLRAVSAALSPAYLFSCSADWLCALLFCPSESSDRVGAHIIMSSRVKQICHSGPDPPSLSLWKLMAVYISWQYMIGGGDREDELVVVRGMITDVSDGGVSVLQSQIQMQME